MHNFSVNMISTILLYCILLLDENSTLNFISEDNSATAFVADLDKYSDHFQFRFVQLDHRGGHCDCWAVADLAITDQGYTNTLR